MMHDDTPWFVDFRDVWLAYNEELLVANQFAVEAIDLKVRQGEFIAIIYTAKPNSHNSHNSMTNFFPRFAPQNQICVICLICGLICFLRFAPQNPNSFNSHNSFNSRLTSSSFCTAKPNLPNLFNLRITLSSVLHLKTQFAKI